MGGLRKSGSEGALSSSEAPWSGLSRSSTDKKGIHDGRKGRN